jgi:hypothetical protein
MLCAHARLPNLLVANITQFKQLASNVAGRLYDWQLKSPFAVKPTVNIIQIWSSAFPRCRPLDSPCRHAVNDMELALRAVLSHELVEQIRHRTREGMKTAVRQGKASTCLAHGYMLFHARDANGDRITGLRDMDSDKAKNVRRIFKMYAGGMSPRDIAQQLNKDGVTGPPAKSGAILRSRAMRAAEPAS